MADERGRLEILNEIRNAEREILRLQAEQNDLDTDNIELIDEQKETVKELGKELKKVNEERIKGLADSEKALSSMSSMYSKLTGLEKQRLQTMATLKTQDSALTSEQEQALSRMAEINKEIAELTSADIVQRIALNDEYDTLKSIADTVDVKHKNIVDNLTSQNSLAQNYANMTEGQKEQLEAQLEAYNGIKKTLGGILDTASILTSGPAGFFGTALIGAGMFADKLGETKKALGGINEVGTTALSFLDDNAVENAKELSNQFGGISNVSAELQASTSLISSNMGISGTEAAGLLGSFSRLNDGSSETALNLTKSTQEFAKQNGLIPSQLMADLAGSAEEFALFGKEGGKNLIEAGAAARKMGVDLKTMTGIADNLLDFETSITKELELGAMLGKNINLDRARSLAYQGDIAGATKETLNALGGVDAFNKMDYFQKKATADLLGTSVDELSKMVNQQEQAATIGGQLNEKFSLMGETIDAGLNNYLGTSLKSLGGMIMTGAQLGGSFAQMGMNVKGIGSSIKDMAGNLASGAKSLLSKGWQMLTGAGGNKITESATGAVTEKITGGIKEKATDTIKDAGSNADVGKKGGLMDSMSKIKMSEVLKGAAAMLVVAAAVFVFGKAVQEFMKVSWEAVGMAVVSMLALVGAIALLGAIMTSGVGAVAILAGAAAMLVIAASVLVLGYALQAIGTGFEMMGAGIATLVPNLTMVGEAIMSMVTFIPAIAALSIALMGLSASLIAVGAAGVIALPGLMAVAAVGAIATGVGSLLGIGGEEGGDENSKMDELITEMKALREDLNAGKIAVYMDGTKVTSGVTKVVSKNASNSYGS
jgi:hypothetical protein